MSTEARLSILVVYQQLASRHNIKGFRRSIRVLPRRITPQHHHHTTIPRAPLIPLSPFDPATQATLAHILAANNQNSQAMNVMASQNAPCGPSITFPT